MRTLILSNARCLGLSIAILTLVLLFLNSQAQTAEKLWVGNSGGLWDNPDNWNPVGVPQDGDDVYLVQYVNLLRIVEYKTPYPTAVLNSLTISTIGENGLIILHQKDYSDPLKSRFEIVGGIDYKGLIISGKGMHVQSTGSNTISTTLYLGYTPDSLGTYSLSGTGTLSARSERIGDEGLGQFYQSGGSNTVQQGLVLGWESGSQGLYELSGGQLSSRTLRVGRKGEGTFTHSAGTNTVDQTLTVGDAEGSQGTYNLWASGSQKPELSARKQIVGDAGTGTFNNVYGTNRVTEYVILGSQQSGQGTYYLSYGGSLECQTLYSGYSGTGQFNQFLGYSTVRGSLYLGYQATGEGSYGLVGFTLNAKNEYIGRLGKGSFDHYSGVNAITEKLVLAQFPGSTGTYKMYGGTWAWPQLRIGKGLEVGTGGTFTQEGGEFYTKSITNWGTINLQGGEATVTGDLTNNASGTLNISVGPHGPPDVTFSGDTTNYGTIKTTGVTVTWGGTFTNNGAYISDPSKQTFNNLTVGPSGYLVGYSQDLFVVKGDLEVHSQMPLHWQTDQATLQFVNAGRHLFWLPGEDRGPGGSKNNFKWGTLILGEYDDRGNFVPCQPVQFFDGNEKNQGTALYLGKIAGLEWADGDLLDGNRLVANLIGFQGLNIYYDPYLNPELNGLTYDLREGGHLVPTPVPASVLLLASGLVGLLLLGRRHLAQ